jgi:methyltransferase family protein
MTEEVSVEGSAPCATIDYFDRYMEDGFDRIEGWPGQKRSVEFLKNFREAFSSFGENGGACEIGLHHGKYLIALHNLVAQNKSLGLDLFDDQDRNIDQSGRGIKDICKQNIDAFAKNPHLITLRQFDSMSISSREKQKITEEFGMFSIFSIDGGHTALHVSIDFMTACELTSDSGIIIVDDIFHPDWPGVTEGIYRALDSRLTPFVPFMLTRKKLFLCSVTLQRRFADFVEMKRGEVPRKVVDFARWSIPSLNFGGEY